MKGKVSAICPNCKYCEGMVEDSFYICGVTHSDGGLYHLMGVEDELYCTAYEEEINMNKVEGKVSDFCPKCKNCKGVTNEYDGKTASIRLTEVECEDPYDGMIKTLAADSDICCSMFEMKSEKSCDKISLLRHELEMDKLRRKIHELEKEKADHLKGIERLKKSNNDLKYWKERCHKAETDVTILNSKVETLKNKNEKYLKKITDQQATHYKQCSRIMDLEFAVNKLQSGEYDDILAKDIEIKSLQSKYEDAMAGWNDAIDTNDKIIEEKDKQIEELKKMVERRDRWVKELQSDVYTLQNEVLTIRDIAQKAYDDTNRD